MTDKGKKDRLLEHRSFRWLVLIELWLLLVLCGLLLVRQEYSYYFPETVWEYDSGGNACMKPLTLSRGLYRVQITYQCDTDMKYLAYAEQYGEATGRGSTVQCGGEYLRQGNGVTDFDLWITDSQVQVVLKAQYGNEEAVLKNVAVLQKQEDIFQAMLLVVGVGLVANAVCICWLRRGSRSREQNRQICVCWLGIAVITVIASVPLFLNSVWVNQAILGQLFRIGGLKEGLLGGQFPVRLAPGYFAGNGYASPVYQGELFWYFPALLRVLGIPLQSCWKWFLLGNNLATCVAAFLCLRRIVGSSRKAMLGSAVYTLFPLRLYGLYRLGAVDVVLAALFLPIVLYGLYELLFLEEEKQRNGGWLALALGFTGLLQSHLGCFAVVDVAAGIICIFKYKSLQRRAVQGCLCKVVAGLLVWNLWFLVPALDYLCSMDMAWQHGGADAGEEVSGQEAVWQEQYQEGWYCIYDEKALSAIGLSDGRYLPYGTAAEELLWHPPMGREGISITGYERQYLDLIIECENTSEQEGFIDVPFVNYRGYRAQSLVNGSFLQIEEDEKHCVRVVVPEGFQGRFHVFFEEPWYWKMAVWASLLGIAVAVAWSIRRRLNAGLQLIKD